MIKKTKKRLSAKTKMMIIFDFIGIIILWRGIWGMLDVFLFPNDPLISYGISILLGTILIFIDGDGIRDISR